MRIHLETQRLRERLVADINQSGLPTMCARMVAEDLSRQLRDQEARALQLEAQAEAREQQQQKAARQQKRAAHNKTDKEEA